jgi:glycosyltransferase involved in cell wall biosynthesis
VRLAFVTSRYPPHTGGVETHVAELAERFARAGHDVVVHTADRAPLAVGSSAEDERGDADAGGLPAPPRERRNGVLVRRHRGLAPGGAFHVAPGIAPAIRRADVDLVHAHNYHSLPVLFAALGTAGRDVPLVVTPHYHGGSASGLRDRLLAAYRPLGGWALRRADAIVAVSDWERRRLAADFGVDARVIPNGLDVERFVAARETVDAGRGPEEDDGVGSGRAGVESGRPAAGGTRSTADEPGPASRPRPYLLSVGRVEAYKGVQHVVRALEDLPEYDLVVAGSGPYLDGLRSLAREAGVADRVDCRGYVPDDHLPGLYAGAAAFVTMSTFEAYGMTVAEALAAGTPCVVRPAGALVDWTDRADCVAAPPDDLPTAVREAVGLDAPAEPLPTWDDVVDRVAGVYADVLGPSRDAVGTP